MGRGNGFQLSLVLAVAASLAFLLFLAVRPVGDESVKLTANLAQLVAPLLAAVSNAWAAAACWMVGQATWVWFEHLARREQPVPSLADVGYLGPSPWPSRPC